MTTTVLRRTFASATLVATLALAACSSSDTPTVEQTVEATPTADVPDVIVPSGEFSADGINSTNAEWLAETDPNYVFSDVPQSDSEMWLYLNYRDQWDLGVRAVSGKYVEPYTWGDESHYAVMVQYIDGVRYEGTSSFPLGFRGQIEDPDSLATDSYDRIFDVYQNSSLTNADVGNYGQGGYAIEIMNTNGDRNTFTLKVVARDSYSIAPNGVWSAEFGSIDEAMAFLESTDFRVDVGDRVLNAGEIANISAVEFAKANSDITTSVYNPVTGEWEVAVTSH